MALDSDALAELLDRCHDDPDGFNAVMLGRGEFWSRQQEICRALVRYKTVVVPTGNSVGKSYMGAGICLWWLYTRPGSQVIITAPSQTLLGTVLFKEIRRALGKNPFNLPGRLSESPKVSPQVLEIDGTGWGALGIATKGVERLSGQHNPALLQIVDEASGVEDEIFEALESQNPAKLLLLGNPLRSTGRFPALYKRALREMADESIPDREKCVAIRIPSTESPDIELDRSPRGLADRGFILEAERNYGRESLYWKTHVDALFPETDTAKLVPSAWLDAAEEAGRKLKDHPRSGPHRIAVDLGGGNGGDSTVILVRDENGVRAWGASNQWSLEESAAKVRAAKDKFGVDSARIVFDQGGIGHDFAGRLAAVGIKGAVGYRGSASGGKKFRNLRSASAWQMRMRLDPNGRDRDGRARPQFAIPPDLMLKLRRELQDIEYTEAGGMTQLEDAETTADRLGHSPDFAATAIMAWAFIH